jgi:hypothetical protein
MSEDRVAQALEDLCRATTATVVAPEVGVIVGRARKRRATRAVLASIVAVAVIVGTVAVGRPYLDRAPTPPASEPATEGRLDPLRANSTRLPLTFMIFAGSLQRPLPGGLNPVGSDGGIRVKDFLYSGCLGTPDEQLETTAEFDDGSAVTKTLSLYADETAAAAAFTTVETDLRRCVGFPDTRVFPEGEPLNVGPAVAVSVTFDMPASSSPARAVAFRVDRVIGILLSTPHDTETTRHNAVPMELLAALARDVVPSLCLYADAGCSPQPGLPHPLTSLTRGGQAWLVLIDIYQSMSDHPHDWSPDPGLDLYEVARLGYYPSMVRQGCDEGANVADAGKEASTRYLALYFATQHEADAVVRALPPISNAENPLPRVLKVRTWC